MTSPRFHLPPATPATRRAAAACIEKLATMTQEMRCRELSPRQTIAAVADRLENDSNTADQIWVARANQHDQYHQQWLDSDVDQSDDEAQASRSAARHSAWPLWFLTAADGAEIPLLYLFRSATIDGLREIAVETAGHGILCNDVGLLNSRWPQGVQPSLAMWLAENQHCTPYDPASGTEAHAILLAALQALYMEEESGFYYLSMHDDINVCRAADISIPDDIGNAVKGMYLFAAAGSVPGVRLCGAGTALTQVVEAAQLLAVDWNVSAEVWSCPSYTRLAREGRACERWNMLRPLSAKRQSHIQTCLGTSQAPVIAITGYARHIAEQIRSFAAGQFIALGADSDLDSGRSSATNMAVPPNARRIAVIALRALMDDGVIPVQVLQSALKKYQMD